MRFVIRKFRIAGELASNFDNITGSRYTESLSQ
jgi:hypothetical protein